MQEKILTLIIPSYNMEQYLPKCLGSLVGGKEKVGGESRSTADGSYLDLLDVIVVNDGSKDCTSEIAHEFEKRYPGVFHVIDKPNGHYGSCINAALPKAKGRFIKVLDADDSFDTKNFSDYLSFLTGVGDVDLVTNDYDVVDDKGVVTEHVALPYPEGIVFGMKELTAARHELIMHGVSYRTAIFKEIGYKQTEGCVFTDTEWMFEPMLKVRKIVRFPKVVYRYLVGREGQSVSAALAVKLLPVQMKIFNNILEIYKKRKDGVDETYRDYMILYLARIYRIIFGVYFLRNKLALLKREFWPFHECVLAVVPECTEIKGCFGTIFAGHPYQIDCAHRWFKSGGSYSFWAIVYRGYYYVRKPLRFMELFVR